MERRTVCHAPGQEEAPVLGQTSCVNTLLVAELDDELSLKLSGLSHMCTSNDEKVALSYG